MSNAIQLTTAQAVRRDDWDEAKVKVVRQVIAKGLSDSEFEVFLHVCKRTGLDPMARQIYALKRREYDRDSGGYVEKMSIQTGIDGFRLVAERTGRYAPGRRTEFKVDENGNVISAIAFVKKQTPDGTWHEVEEEAYYDEYVARQKDGRPMGLWGKPRIMLGKCAEARALRRAFPVELSGVYTGEEMAQADNGQAPQISVQVTEDGEVVEPERDKSYFELVRELEVKLGELTSYDDARTLYARMQKDRELPKEARARLLAKCQEVGRKLRDAEAAKDTSQDEGT